MPSSIWCQTGQEGSYVKPILDVQVRFGALQCDWAQGVWFCSRGHPLTWGEDPVVEIKPAKNLKTSEEESRHARCMWGTQAINSRESESDKKAWVPGIVPDMACPGWGTEPYCTKNEKNQVIIVLITTTLIHMNNWANAYRVITMYLAKCLILQFFFNRGESGGLQRWGICSRWHNAKWQSWDLNSDLSHPQVHELWDDSWQILPPQGSGETWAHSRDGIWVAIKSKSALLPKLTWLHKND